MKRFHFALSVALVLALSAAVLSGCAWQDSPTLAVSALLHDENGHTTLTWIVENRSDQTVSFDENCLAIVETGASSRSYPSDACTIGPGESAELSIPVGLGNRNNSTSIRITARCNEGTEVSYALTIPAVE